MSAYGFRQRARGAHDVVPPRDSHGYNASWRDCPRESPVRLLADLRIFGRFIDYGTKYTPLVFVNATDFMAVIGHSVDMVSMVGDLSREGR
jgi:hypothetical protein